MYEQIDSLYSWAIQHNAQEILGILALCLAVLVPIAAIVLASVDVVLDYALRYINEDQKTRRIISGKLSYKFSRTITVSGVSDIIEGHRTWILSTHPEYKLLQDTLSAEDRVYCKDSEGDYVVRRLKSIADKYLSVRKTRELTIYLVSPKPVLAASAVCILLSSALYFLPFWLLVTVAICYGTLRTARFATRVSKKFNKHLNKEHSNETQGK